MNPTQIVLLAVFAAQLAAELKALATTQIDSDPTITAEQKAAYLARIDAAQRGVVKIDTEIEAPGA